MSQHGEMDLHVRYFDEDFVPTRYISSAFLGRGTGLIEGVSRLFPHVDLLRKSASLVCMDHQYP